MNIYFAGSIRGGRQDAETYRRMIARLQTRGTVLTEHIGHQGLSPEGESTMTDQEIHDRDLEWLRLSDAVVAEVTNPSLGVGYEIAMAVGMKKKVLCLYQPRPGTRLSAMIAGCHEVIVKEYQRQEEAFQAIDAFLDEITDNLPAGVQNGDPCTEHGHRNKPCPDHEVCFEPMDHSHQQDVMDIFNHYIAHSFAAYPENLLPEPFFERILEMTKGYPAYVIKTGRKCAGFCFLRAYNPHSTFRTTAEITYFIHPDHTGMGLGKLALERLEGEARLMGIRSILASISSLNDQSLAFHRKNGFTECGRLKGIGMKKQTTFDVVWMQKVIR